jgi:hypothetical protein
MYHLNHRRLDSDGDKQRFAEAQRELEQAIEKMEADIAAELKNQHLALGAAQGAGLRPKTLKGAYGVWGTSHKAANWFLVRCTQGLGRQPRFRKGRLPLKSIYLFPLRKDCRKILRKKSASE